MGSLLTIRKSDIVNEMQRLVLIAIIVVVVLGALWYVYSGKQSSMPYSGNQAQESSMGNKMSGKIADLINAGKSLECNFSSDINGYKSSGTVYVSGQKVRGDFKSEAEGKMMDSHMIQDGETIYTWTTDPKQGMMVKISKEDVEKYQDGPAGGSNKSFNIDQSYDYDCKAWGANPSKFEKPADIQFIDLSAQMKKATESMDQGAGAACSACDQIEDEEAKASCKQALNC